MSNCKPMSRTLFVMGLLPALLHSGVVQANCAEELEKLKAAANAYKTTIDQRAILPDDIKELMRARYKRPYGYSFTPFNTEDCLKRNLTTTLRGGWERQCAEYQRIRRRLHAWHETVSSRIQEDAYEAYRVWNAQWPKTRTLCLLDDETDHSKAQINALKRGGLVPSERDL